MLIDWLCDLDLPPVWQWPHRRRLRTFDHWHWHSEQTPMSTCAPWMPLSRPHTSTHGVIRDGRQGSIHWSHCLCGSVQKCAALTIVLSVWYNCCHYIHIRTSQASPVAIGDLLIKCRWYNFMVLHESVYVLVCNLHDVDDSLRLMLFSLCN